MEPSCSMRTGRLTHRHDKANSHFLRFCEQLEKKQALLQYRIRVTANYSDRTSQSDKKKTDRPSKHNFIN